MSDYLELAKKARERADKATPGPWHGDAHDGSVKYKMLGADDRVVYRIHTNYDWDDEPERYEVYFDEEFIMAARTDVPALCDAVEELAAEVERQGEEIEQLTAELAAVRQAAKEESNG